MSIFEFNSLTEQLSKLDELSGNSAGRTLADAGQQAYAGEQRPHHSAGADDAGFQRGSLSCACRCPYGRRSRKILCGKRLSGGSGCPAGQRICPSWITQKSASRCAKSEAGTFTPHGYVVRTEELEPLPDYEPQREISYMIRLTLMNHENEQKTAVLDLPATEQRLLEVQKELDAPEWFDAQFTGCDAIAPQLNSHADRCGRSSADQRTGAGSSGTESQADSLQNSKLLSVRRSVRRWTMSSTALKSCRNTASRQKSAIRTRWCVMSWNLFSAARMQT